MADVKFVVHFSAARLLSIFLLLIAADFGHIQSALAFGHSFSLYNYLSPSNFNCLHKWNPQAVPAVRIYAGGRTDTNGLPNLRNARNAGFVNFEVYVQPNPLGSKQAWQQFDEAYNYVSSDKSFKFVRLWLLVTDPTAWSTSAESNVKFIQTFLQRAQSNRVQVGIYSSWYDWLLITRDNSRLSPGIPLWYWHALGQGANKASDRDMSDFRAFGPWRSAGVKEYDIVDNSVCGITLNWSIFQTNGAESLRAANEQQKEKKQKYDENEKNETKDNRRKQLKVLRISANEGKEGADNSRQTIVGSAFPPF